MSLLALEIEVPRPGTEQETTHRVGSTSFMNDWIVSDLFETTSSDGQSSPSDDDFDFFSQLTKPKILSTQQIQNISLADLEHADEAEQAWQAIRNYQGDVASPPSPENQPYVPEFELDEAQSSPVFSLISDTEPQSPINENHPAEPSYLSPQCPPNSPTQNLFGRNGFHTLSLRPKSSISSPPLPTRIQKHRAKPISPSKMSTSPCRSFPTQRTDRLAATSAEQFNISGGLLSSHHPLQLVTQAAQGGQFHMDTAANYSSQLLGPLNNGYITPMASSTLVNQRSSSEF